MQIPSISLKTASGTIPTPTGNLYIAQTKVEKDRKLFVRPDSQSAPTLYSASGHNTGLSLLARTPQTHQPQTLLFYSQKGLDLKNASDKARCIADITERRTAFQKVAEGYRSTIESIRTLDDSGTLSQDLTKALRDLILTQLIPLYLQGYIPALWFQDYALYVPDFADDQGEHKVRFLVKVCLVEIHASTSATLEWHEPAPNSFEEKVGQFAFHQLHFLSLFLKGDTQSLPVLLSRMEELFQEWYINYPYKLGFHIVADAYVFLIRQGRTASIEGFLQTYQAIYQSLRNPSLEQLLSLCIGWKRFFMLKCTQIDSIAHLYLKDSSLACPLVELYLVSLKTFQEACEKCAWLLKDNLSYCLPRKTYKADLVACLSIALKTVQDWNLNDINRLSSFALSARDDLAAYARELQQSINEKIRPILGAYAKDYTKTADEGYIRHAKAAQAIAAFLIQT
jgi:hypothetical protein